MTMEKRREALVAKKTQEAAAAKAAMAAATRDAARFESFTRQLLDSLAGGLDYVITEERVSARSTKLHIGFGKFSIAMWNAFVTTYRNMAEGTIDIEDVRIPIPQVEDDKRVMLFEFADNLLPYLFWRHHVTMPEFFYREGPYELGKVALRPGDVVLDCGANVGMVSAVASRKGCAVHAFEPMDYIRDKYLNRTAELNGDIEVHPLAVGDKEREVDFTLNTYNIGASRQTPSDTGGGIQGVIQKVRMTTIDNFVRERGLKRVDFIKADIEGAERHMLAGAAETIKRFRPRLSICTYHLPDDPKLLRDMVLDIEPGYHVVEKYMKLYAWCGD